MNVDNGLRSRSNAAVTIAKKWAIWSAGFGALFGVSGVLKGSGTLIGKMLLSAIVAGILALISGGITLHDQGKKNRLIRRAVVRG